MASETFGRTCRYNHGPLRRAEGFEDGFALPGVKSRKAPDGAWDGVDLLSAGLLLDVYDCPVCGYTELVERGK